MSDDYAEYLKGIVDRLGHKASNHPKQQEIKAKLKAIEEARRDVTKDVQSLAEIEAEENERLILPPNMQPRYDRLIAQGRLVEAEKHLRQYGRPRGYLYPVEKLKTETELKREVQKAIVDLALSRRRMLDINSQPINRREPRTNDNKRR